MSRVLITGMAGFIGSHLKDRLSGEGQEVWGVDNLETGRRENAPGVEVLDIADREALYEVANELRPELVIHCAASYKDPDKWHRDTDTNVTGTINVTLVAKHHGAKIVYFQTGLPPISSYAITKLAGEQFIRLSGVPHLIFRLANVYGPRNVSGPIPAFYKRITEGQPCTVVDTTRDVVYISDLVDCVMLALRSGSLGTYDVCSGAQTSIMDQWQAVSDALPISPNLDHFDPRLIGGPPLVPVAEDDVQPAVTPDKGVPGWACSVSLGDGVREAVAWYMQHGISNTYTHLAVKG